VAAIQHEQGQIEHDLAALPEKYSLSTHNDTLAQTRALYEILAEDPFLKIKVGAIFLLLFLIAAVSSDPARTLSSNCGSSRPSRKIHPMSNRF
jgi:hypothetical protein